MSAQNGIREGWRCDFSGAVEARARLRDKANTNKHNLLCQAPPAPGNLTPSQGEGAMNTTSENQAATVRDQEGWPHRVIRRGEAVRPLPPHARSLPDLALDVGEDRRSLVDYMTRSRTVGLLILKDGEVALERYGMGRGPARRCTMARSAAWTTAARITCRGCAARPTRGSRSAMSCGCAPAWPGTRQTTDTPTPGACNRRWPAGGQAPSWSSRAACRAFSRKGPYSTIRPSRRACLARWSRPPPGGRWPTTAPRRSGGPPAWRPTRTGYSNPRAVWSGAGLASARACATSAASAYW